MSIDHTELRRVMGHFATGVTVITTRDVDGKPYGLTANALCSVSLAPPLLLVCIDKRAESHPAFERSGLFAIAAVNSDGAANARCVAVDDRNPPLVERHRVAITILIVRVAE